MRWVEFCVSVLWVYSLLTFLWKDMPDIIFRQLFCSEKHQEQISICTWSVKNVLMVLEIIFALLTAAQMKKKKKLKKNSPKCGEKIFRFITDLCLLFFRPFLSPTDNKCHVSFIARPPKRKHLFTEVEGSLSFQKWQISKWKIKDLR